METSKTCNNNKACNTKYKGQGVNTFSMLGSDLKKKWWIIDVETANTRVLGRIATKIAMVLKGKHKPTFTPHLDCGDNVILINADKIQVTGEKEDQKMYYRHSGYLGHLRSRTFKEQKQKNPAFVVKEAVKGMIRRTTLRRYIMKHFYVYQGSEHPHMGQKPEVLGV